MTTQTVQEGGRTRTFLIALWAVLGFVAAPATMAQEQPDAPLQIAGAATVNAEKVIDLIGKTPNLVLLDNRKEADFNAGHEMLAKHVKTKDTPVLFYCNGLKCGRAAKAAAQAVGWGYTKVYYYALGMDEWKKQNLPLVATPAG